MQKTAWIRIGDFFFKYRNAVFPLLWCVLLVAFPPALGTLHKIVAIAFVVAGLGLRGAVIGFAYIKRGGLNKQVYADTLVTEGFFTLCRNPLYVGNMLIYAGVFVMHGNPAVMVLGIGGSFMIYQTIIAAEEFFLRQKFGAAYTDYCARTSRWFLRLDRLPAAIKGMRFHAKRVLVKDYSTIANAVATMLFVDLLDHYYLDTPEAFQHSLILHGEAIVALMLAAALISFAKKKKILTAVS